MVSSVVTTKVLLLRSSEADWPAITPSGDARTVWVVVHVGGNPAGTAFDGVRLVRDSRASSGGQCCGVPSRRRESLRWLSRGAWDGWDSPVASRPSLRFDELSAGSSPLWSPVHRRVRHGWHAMGRHHRNPTTTRGDTRAPDYLPERQSCSRELSAVPRLWAADSRFYLAGPINSREAAATARFLRVV